MKSKDCRLTCGQKLQMAHPRSAACLEGGGALGVSDRDQVVTVWVFLVFFRVVTGENEIWRKRLSIKKGKRYQMI
jgi:hypothetical protein